MMAETLASRIKRLREKAGVSQEALAKDCGTSQQAIQQLEDGKVSRPRYLIELAAALDTSAEYLLHGENLTKTPQNSRNLQANNSLVHKEITSQTNQSSNDLIRQIKIGHAPKDVPIRGAVAAGPKGAIQLTSDVIGYAHRPLVLIGDGDAYALYVQGESMSPWKEPGDVIVVTPNRPYKKGDYVVVQIQKDENEEIISYVKKLKNNNQKTLTLEQHKPKKILTFDNNTVVSIHKVMENNDILGV